MDLRAILDEVVCATRDIRSKAVREGNSGVSGPTVLFFQGDKLAGMVGLPDNYGPGLFTVGMMTDSDVVVLVTEEATATGGVMKIGVHAPEESILVALPYISSNRVTTFADPITRAPDPILLTDERAVVQEGFRKRAKLASRPLDAFLAMLELCGAESVALYLDSVTVDVTQN